jgi:hypothetical protein
MNDFFSRIIYLVVTITELFIKQVKNINRCNLSSSIKTVIIIKYSWETIL